VLAHLHDRQLLLILDTCEHLIDACAMFAEEVISRTPRVTLLATSREPLDVSGENACPVPPLPVPDLEEFSNDGLGGGDSGQPAHSPVRADAWRDRHPGEAGREGVPPGNTAVDLFIQRAAAAVPGFTVTPANLPDVIRLCRRLDGIPLAIELAAVRLRALPLGELTNRLDQRLALLTSGQRGDRHRTLRDAIGWSHDLCSPAEQAMWARLSVFAGPFTMSAAEAVCAEGPDDDQVMPAVIRLVDKSVLVRIDAAADTDGQPTQYLMLDMIREFGAERLAESGTGGSTRNRFVARYLAMARHFRDHFLDDDQLVRLRELRREHANLGAALEYALGDAPFPPGEDPPAAPPRDIGYRITPDRDDRSGGAERSVEGLVDTRRADGVELAIALSAYWRARGLAREGGYWLGRAAEHTPEGSAAWGRAVLERGHMLIMQGDATGALAAAAQVLALADALGDEDLAARGCLVRTAALSAGGRLAAAAESGDEARRRLTALGDQLGLIGLDLQLTYLALLKEDIEAALGHVERGLRQLSDSRERSLHANLYMLASLTLYLAGRDIESTWTVTRALQVKQKIGDFLGIAFSLELLGWLAARSGSHQRAAWLLGGADPLWQRAGGPLPAAFQRLHAEAAASCGDALGDRQFAELFARGARHPSEAMIAFALNDLGHPAEDGATTTGAAGIGAAKISGTRIRLPSQLTAREREIASLVAAGLSNRQIAEKLVISRRTVDAHLEHIYSKLGITSRVMLTIQLREHSAETGG